MPVLEFALDASTLSRIQVHISTHQGPVSVMLDRNVIGSLATREEQLAGKDFRLPDNSILRVRILNGRPQAWRDGHPLTLTSTSKISHVASGEPHGRLPGSVIALLILNVVVTGGLCIWFLTSAILAMPSPKMPQPLLLSSLLALVGLIGVGVLLSWKRWGFYLATCYVVANFILAILSGIIDYRTFLPLISLALLLLALSSSGTWRKMT